MAQKKKSTPKQKKSPAKKKATPRKSPSKAVVKSNTAEAVKDATQSVAAAVAEDISPAEKYVQDVLNPVIVYANDLKSKSLRQRVLAWFKTSK